MRYDVFTSNMIEERNKEYKWKLQLIDTANFFVLAGAILVIIQKPNEFIERLNLFGWKPPIDGFWACIGSYFFFLAWWNKNQCNLSRTGNQTLHNSNWYGYFCFGGIRASPCRLPQWWRGEDFFVDLSASFHSLCRIQVRFRS